MRIGTDIVEIARLNDHERLAKRILSDKEYSLYSERTNKQEFLAGHYAAKEAFLKATGKGLGFASLNKIEVLYDTDGAPYVLYDDVVYPTSISHDGEYAISVVLFQ